VGVATDEPGAGVGAVAGVRVDGFDSPDFRYP
jgi:hypothetical protein